MRILLFISIFCTFSFQIFPQNQDVKRDHVWVFGYPGGLSNPEPPFGNALVDFNLVPPNVYSINGIVPLAATNSSICNIDGELLFFTNGIYVGKSNGQIMANGTGLSPGLITNDLIDVGMVAPGGALILPMPGKDNLYIVFHGLPDILDEPPLYYYSHWYYSLVDITKLNGQGAVIEKNVEILNDTLAVGNLSAVRHGNGRDWWIFIPKFNSNVYFYFLLTPEGLEGLYKQEIGNIVDEGLGQTLFSPDGTKYVRNELNNYPSPDTIHLYNFDRCTGLLSNPRHIAYADSAWSGGAAFSPNSRYLYVTHYRHIFQFDTEAADLLASMDTIATWVPDSNVFSSRFYMAELAPDGKIYVNANGGISYLHVINYPDLKGDSCGFVQNGFELPVYNSFSLPTFPNFRLGKWEGSPCDTIVVSSTKPNMALSKIFVYPNPANEFVVIDNEIENESEMTINILDVAGKTVFQKIGKDNSGEQIIDTSRFPPGMYFYFITGKSGVIKSGKLVIQR